MSVDLPISISLKDMHREAIDDVNRWRGHCTELFARIDVAVTSTLDAFAAIGAVPKAPHLFGQRMNAMRKALQPGGPLADKGAAALKVLDKLDPHLERRNIVVHATGSVWINAGGAWLWRYRMTPSGRTGSIEKGSFDRDDALGIEKQFAPLCRSFCDHLRNLRPLAAAQQD